MATATVATERSKSAARRFEGRPVEALAWAAERFPGGVTFATGLRRRGLRDHRPDRAPRAADRPVHARHRPAVPRDLRALAQARGSATASRSARCARRRPSPSRRWRTASGCGSATPTAAASCARSSPLRAGARRLRRVDHRDPPRPDARARGARGRRARREASASSRSTRSSRWTHDDVWALPARARRARTTRCTSRATQHRLPALHVPGRGPARTRAPAAGAARQDRMRPACPSRADRPAAPRRPEGD